MRALSQLMACCGKDLEEPEAEVTLQIAQRRAHSENNRTARIQRSLGKPKPLDSSTKHSLFCTHQNGTPSHSANRRLSLTTKGHSPSHSCQSHQQQTSFLVEPQAILPHHLPIPHLSEQNLLPCQTSTDPLASRHTPSQIESMNIIPEPPNFRVPAPRLLVDRRIRKSKEQEESLALTQQKLKRKEVINRRSAFVTPVLETIEERPSLASCSQIQDLNKISSRSFFSPSNDRLPEAFTASQRFSSCMIGRNDSPGLAMAQSENFQRFEEKLSHQHEKLIASKIRVDIEISTNELGALLQEEQYLLERSLFSRQQCQTDLERLVKTKQQMRVSLSQLEARTSQKLRRPKGQNWVRLGGVQSSDL